MAFGNNSVSNDTLIKELYSDENVTNALFMKNKFHALLPTNEAVPGRHYVWPIIDGTGQGRSASFTVAQSMASLTGEIMHDFFVPLQENHADANVASKLIAQSSSDKGAFLKAVKLIADDQLINFGNDLAVSEYRTASGSRGRIANSSLSTSVISFVVPKDVLNFMVGMQLDLAAAEVSGGVKAYGSNSHGLYVIKVDYVACTITVGTLPSSSGAACNITDVADGIPTAAQNDYIFVRGDRNLKLNGFQDWIPYGGPLSGDSFLSVDRTSNPALLAGLWLDGTSGQSLAATLEDAIAQVGELGGELTHFMMPFKKYASLAKELGGKGVVDLVSVPVTPTVGFEGIKVTGSTGSVVCLPDRACPANTIAGVNIDTWELLSVGKAVHVWDEDGKVWLRSPTDSGMEIRFYSFANLLCKDPKQNINVRVVP